MSDFNLQKGTHWPVGILFKLKFLRPMNPQNKQFWGCHPQKISKLALDLQGWVACFCAFAYLGAAGEEEGERRRRISGAK